MRTAAETEVRRPSAVRAMTVLLAVTAAATVVVEVLNWWYAPEQGFGLAVRTGWAMLRSIGFLLLIGHVRRGRTVARPLGLILAVTTVIAVGRLIVPRHGVPPLPGLLGFALLTALCVAVVWLLYRSPAIAGHLVRHRPRLVIERSGIFWRETPPRRPEANAWLLTSRVAAFTYSPLMLVPALVAVAEILDGRPFALPAVLFWLAAGIATSYLVLFCTAFLMRGKRWAGILLVVITVIVLAVDLPLCWWLLGVDGLIRDGTPLVAAAILALYGVRRASTAAPAS
ncbi:hypothetical protein [Micromonospora maris]|uniref:Uncharacterized protein n=1 Tax=Micromonospora maris TaxID=1003110 RepID=A0A9X0I7N9_9ACTN|nr:hypothetical protein [Micromonospora maris]AEB42912.1 hypothetical protein VAB18032_08970 [Micromonospora maris AB-18-032]KUJ48308.1 hypothetical protein ADL17_04415 [Micromonospora maris]